jgi:hypothetical protein
MLLIDNGQLSIDNPARPNDFGHSGRYQLSIYNAVGQKVYSIAPHSGSTLPVSLSIDLSSQPKGIYFLQVFIQSKDVINRKIVIQ